MKNFKEFKIEHKQLNHLIGGKIIETKPGMVDKALGVTRDEHNDRNNNGEVDKGDSYTSFFGG